MENTKYKNVPIPTCQHVGEWMLRRITTLYIRSYNLVRTCSYNIVFLVLTYGIPMLIMVVCYTIMGKELWGSQSIGEHTQRQHESVKSKKKVGGGEMILFFWFAVPSIRV